MYINQGMTVTRHRRWNNRGHRNRATVTVTVKMFLSGGDGDGEYFFVRRWRWRLRWFLFAGTDGYGNVLTIVECG